jgi:hypothetical protein
MENIVKQELRSLNYEDVAALVTTGAAAGIAVTKITGHSKTLGAVAGVGISLLLYGILNRKK